MLISDSMSLLWLSYALLSLVVLGTGYLGLAFLPRLPRLVITWAVAGVMWVPASFRLPLMDEGEFYTGLAPAVVVAGLAFLEGDLGAMAPALLLVAVAAGIGALVGLLLWRRGRHTARPAAHDESVEADASSARGRQEGGDERREPVIG
ncbi:hypothetical protein [Halomonas nitroreducens]|uniref:Uncharacterized protein n=1 Tax=Halomonas nitroreducens TaxID=447425 RepID=A0A431V6W8_9GAMM|nr:hypothetical protein [Halomonas nitroreducens]RTR05226.1 hypothetical protein EKG36_06470 [Halomonas nitroreducens]